MYTVIKEGEISIDIPITERANNLLIQRFDDDRQKAIQEVNNHNDLLLNLEPQKYRAFISREGFNNIKSLMPKRAEKQVQHYVDYLEWKLSKCLILGTSLLEYHEMTKDYKAKWFKGAKNDFTALKGVVFIPYLNPKSGKESYINGSRGKCYRINPLWVQEYVIFELDKRESTSQVQETSIMSDKNKSKCELMDATLGLITTRIDIVNDDELINTAKDEISSYLIKTGINQYEYIHNSLGFINLKIGKSEYDAFIQMESIIQSKYLKYRLSRLMTDTNTAKRNSYEGRLYHRLTNFPKKLYKCLLFDREEIGEIDMANCFPSLLIMAITGEYDPFDQFQGNQDTKAFNIASWEKKNLIYSLVRHTKRGGFYEYITHLLYPRLSKEERSLRKKYIKIQISKILFGKYNSTSWIKEKLKKKIPLFITVIDTQKRRYVNSFKNPLNQSYYKEFSKGGEKSIFKTGNDIISILGMRTESTLFLDKIFPQLLGQPFLTKHDAILCPKSQIGKIKTIMMNVLDEELGKGNYQLKTEVYNRNKILNPLSLKS